MKDRCFSSSRALRALPAVLLLLAVVAGALSPTDVSAHERRRVGKYELVVGFSEEPVIEGQPNGVDLRVMDTEANPLRPVEGVEKTLKVRVVQGPASREMTLQPVFRQPGHYRTVFFPTRPGRYVFQFSGTIEALAVNERFESGPGRFNDVEAADALQFPDAVPAARAISQQAVDAGSAAQQAQAAASAAMLLGATGAVAGIAGLVLGVMGLVARRPRGGPPGP